MKRASLLRRSLFLTLFGVLMFLSDLLMDALPNVHLVGVLLALATCLYRRGALISLYIYVTLTGLFFGFAPTWLPHLYIWLPLWGAVMLLPKRDSKLKDFVLLPLVCGLHGLLYGALYAPVQALLFRFSFEQTLLWIAAGFYFDLLHAVGNFTLSFLIPPLRRVLLRLESKKT